MGCICFRFILLVHNSNPQIRQNDHNLQTAKLHGGCVVGSKTFGDNTAQLTRSPHFSSSSTDVRKGAAVSSSVLHDMRSLLLASYLAPKLGVLPLESCHPP